MYKEIVQKNMRDIYRKVNWNAAVLAIAVASILAIAPSVTMAAAQRGGGGGNPHFVGGEPQCTLTGETVRCTGASIAGLGANERVTVSLVVEGTCEVECENPGGNIAPGQDTEASGETTTTVTCDQNGRCNIPAQTATLEEPTQQDLRNACPNRSWTPMVGECTATGFTYTITARGFQFTDSG
jgi:hypothetical protein